MGDMAELLSLEVDNTFSSAILFCLGKKGKFQGLSSVCVYVCAHACVYKQVAHMPMIHVFLLEISVVDMLEKLGT